MSNGEHPVDDRNLAPTPNEMSVRITRSAGKTYVSWTEHGVRESVTIDDLTAHATDARGYQFIASDARVVQLFLRGTGLAELVDLGARLWETYRDVESRDPDPYTGPHYDTVPDSLPPQVVEQIVAELRKHPRHRLLDRSLRPLDADAHARLAGRLRYSRVAMTHIVDTAPPYVAVDLVTVWTGRDAALPDCPPQVFETRLIPRSQAAVDMWPEGRTWAMPGCDDRAARAGHLDLAGRVAEVLGCPVAVAIGSRGRRRDVKPLAGLGARQRRQARGLPARSAGRVRVRGRGPLPDRWVSWAWNPRTGRYDVDCRIDPVAQPARAAAKAHGRRRLDRRRRVTVGGRVLTTR